MDIFLRVCLLNSSADILVNFMNFLCFPVHGPCLGPFGADMFSHGCAVFYGDRVPFQELSRGPICKYFCRIHEHGFSGFSVLERQFLQAFER